MMNEDKELYFIVNITGKDDMFTLSTVTDEMIEKFDKDKYKLL